jgi:hypothetical protein
VFSINKSSLRLGAGGEKDFAVRTSNQIRK